MPLFFVMEENMNSSEKIAQGANLILEGLSEVINEFAKNLSEVLKVFNTLQCQKSKKPRLPRKIKKQYKKLGIYEAWKEGNGLC